MKMPLKSPVSLGASWGKLLQCWSEIAVSGVFTEGTYVRRFEQVVSEFYEDTETVAVNSAGAGLFTLFKTLSPKSTVFVPNNTFFATGEMARQADLTVRLVDCSTEDFCLSLETVQEAARCWGVPRALVLTHIGGGIAKDYARIAQWCEQSGVLLFEDAAHTLGVKTKNGVVSLFPGALGDAAVFSLYPTKAVPVGEGGVILTRDKNLADGCRLFRNYGKYRDGSETMRYLSGFNFRMDEWTAALAWVQMCRLGEILEARNRDAEKLRKVCAPMIDWGGETNWYRFIVPASFGAVRQVGKVYASTDQLDVAMFRGQEGPFPNSDWVAANHRCLPLGEGMYDNMRSADIEAWLMGAGL